MEGKYLRSLLMRRAVLIAKINGGEAKEIYYELLAEQEFEQEWRLIKLERELRGGDISDSECMELARMVRSEEFNQLITKAKDCLARKNNSTPRNKVYV